MRSVPVLLCLMRANRLEWKNEKCACDQQGSNALVMVFSFKLSTETRDMRRSQTKPAVHCFAGGRLMLPWMTQNDSHCADIFFPTHETHLLWIVTDTCRFWNMGLFAWQISNLLLHHAPGGRKAPRPNLRGLQTLGFSGCYLLMESYGLWHLWREMTRTNLKIGQ